MVKQKVSRINISKPDELPERQKALRQISVSECEFSKALDKVFLIRTGTALGDIHVAGRLSRTSCSLHPDSLPMLKKISTLSDRHLPEDLLPLWEFCLSISPKTLKQSKIEEFWPPKGIISTILIMNKTFSGKGSIFLMER